MCKDCKPGHHHHHSLSRRGLIAGAGAAVAAATLISKPTALFAADQPNAPQRVTPEEAFKRLMDGNARYAANTPNQRDFSANRASLAAGQSPIAAILSCSDSRVVPDLVFDQSPGDLFVVRLAGNFLDDDGIASLEYAVKFLGVSTLMVVGHSDCGAVAAAVKVVTERLELPGHLPDLIESIKPAVITAHGQHPSDLVAASIVENVKLNVKRMHEDEPILSAALANKSVTAHGGVYDIATGKVNLL